MEQTLILGMEPLFEGWLLVLISWKRLDRPSILVLENHFRDNFQLHPTVTPKSFRYRYLNHHFPRLVALYSLYHLHNGYNSATTMNQMR